MGINPHYQNFQSLFQQQLLASVAATVKKHGALH